MDKRASYEVLGVRPGGSPEEIKRAYRRLVMEYHPDRRGDDQEAAGRLQEINQAYDVLARKGGGGGSGSGSGYGERQDAEWEPIFRGRSEGKASGGRGGTGGGTGGGSGGGRKAFSDDFFRNFLNLRRGRRGPSRGEALGSGAQEQGAGRGGSSATYGVTVTFEEACLGTERHLKMGTGKWVQVKVPAGCEDGAVLRVRGQGRIDVPGEPRGDGFVRVKVEPHRLLRRRGLDIYLDVPVTLPEAVLGAKIPIPTLSSDVLLSVPPGTNNGKMLRLRGRGVAVSGSSGDFYAVLRLVLPEEIDGEFRDYIRTWSESRGYTVRDDWR